MRGPGHESVAAVSCFQLLHDDRDGGRVDVGCAHQRDRAVDVVGVDGLEEFVDAIDRGELLEHDRAFELLFVHDPSLRQLDGGISAATRASVACWRRATSPGARAMTWSVTPSGFGSYVTCVFA